MLSAVLLIQLSPNISLQTSFRMFLLLLLIIFRHFHAVLYPTHCKCLIILVQSPGSITESVIAEISALSPFFAYFLVEVLIDRKSFQRLPKSSKPSKRKEKELPNWILSQNFSPLNWLSEEFGDQ